MKPILAFSLLLLCSTAWADMTEALTDTREAEVNFAGATLEQWGALRKAYCGEFHTDYSPSIQELRKKACS